MVNQMNQEMISEYLRRSYFAVDGLWFVITEGECSLDRALEMDEKVWQILPKIQARKAKELLKLEEGGLKDFVCAIKLKLAAEEYDYQENSLGDDHVQITVRRCPWYDILKKVNREHLAPKIADIICVLEFRVWLREFGEDLSFSLASRICDGNSQCVLDFRAG